MPDEALIRRALRVREATETAMERYIREEHDAMVGSARVGMDAARKLWPIECDFLPEVTGSPDGWAIIEANFASAYEALDRAAEGVLGTLLHRALLGEVTTEQIEEAEDEAKIGPRHEASEAPKIGADTGE